MATATRIENDRFRDRWAAQGTRTVEVVNYAVDAIDRDTVLSAAGLPRLGDVYGPSNPSLVVVGYDTERRGQWTDVAVRYEEANTVVGGSGVRPRAGLVYTEMQPSIETVNFRFERLANGDLGRRIPGDGVSVIVPTLQFVVRVFYPDTASAPAPTNLFRIYAGRTNLDQVVLPNLGPNYGNVTMEPGELLYLYPIPGVEDGYRYINHVLQAKASFDAVVPGENIDGTPGAETAYSLYEGVNMTGAWPLGFGP